LTHPVLTRLRDPDASIRREACRAAAEDPSAVLLVDALSEALADTDPAVRRTASEALTRLAPVHDAVREALRRALHSPEPRLRWGAAFTTARLAPPEPGLLPALVDALAAAEADIRWAAARILVDLGRLHPEAQPVAAALARTDPNPRVRRMALLCLQKLAPDDPVTVDVLLEASHDSDRRLRQAALASLAALATPPARVEERRVEERLARALDGDPDPATRRLAASALAVAQRQKISASSE
jgi:HEAT repeat protein